MHSIHSYAIKSENFKNLKDHITHNILKEKIEKLQELKESKSTIIYPLVYNQSKQKHHLSFWLQHLKRQPKKKKGKEKFN